MQLRPTIPKGQIPKHLSSRAGNLGQQVGFWYKRNLELSEVHMGQRDIRIIEIWGSGA